MNRLAALTVLLVTALAVPIAAQPGFFNWWDSPIARDLNLSADQMRKIREVVRDHRPRLLQLRATAETAEGDLGDAMREDPFDMAKASDAAEKAAQARSEMTRALTQLSVRLRAVLTHEQWLELEKRRPNGQQRRALRK